MDEPSGFVAGTSRTPGLVVLGAPRCGTTAVARWLRDAGLGVGVKDSFYLMDESAGVRRARHLSSDGALGYLDLFPNGAAPTVDVAAGYLYQRTALEFFQSWAVPPAFAVIVRDPVARLRSVYRYFSGNLGLLPSSMSFDKYVDSLFAESVGLPDRTVSDALNQGCYAKAVQPWVDAFGYESIAVISFDEVTRAPQEVLYRLVKLLGAGPSFNVGDYSFEAYNNSYVPRSKGAARATAWARKWVPAGRIRSWGGEKVRRLQSRTGQATQDASLAASDGTVDRLHDFYAQPNADLARRYGVDVSAWGVPERYERP